MTNQTRTEPMDLDPGGDDAWWESPKASAEFKRLRRIARDAHGTYVGRHWPSMEDMRRDGIGYGLVEDRAHEALIRRYLDTFQPEFVVDLMDRVIAEAREAARLRSALERAADVLDHFAYYERRNLSHVECGGEPGIHAPLVIEAAGLRAALVKP